MASEGLLTSFLAAIQASLSVLLVVFYGVLAAHFKLLDGPSTKAISKVCVKIFLPALLFVKIGSELHAGSAARYGIILLWAFVAHLVSFLIGVAAHHLFKMPNWITCALMFNNTTSYPLLLIQNLEQTGILKVLIKDEPTRDAVERAKSYFLVFATVSSCLTFAVGPRLIDDEHAPEPPDDKDEEDDGEDNEPDENRDRQPTDDYDDPASPNEETPLVSWSHRASVSFFPSQPIEATESFLHNAKLLDRRPSVVAKTRWQRLGPRTKWWLLFLFDFFNAPLVGAVVGAVVGLVPALHRAFFNEADQGGIFTAWLTASLQNVGSVFVPLPVVIAGVSLYTSYMQARRASIAHPEEGVPWATTIFVLFVRFVFWSVISIAVVYGMAKARWLGDDPMLWFAMMLMPTGPSAMKLITMVQVSDAGDEDEHKIAKLLAVCISIHNGLTANLSIQISYMISPILAFTVVGSLRASQAGLD